MRVCQPDPCFRKCARTSASNRKVVDTFGASDLGRPRFTGARSNFAFHFGVERSGASSASTKAGTVRFLLFAIGFPQRNDAARPAARSPDENDHPGLETADRDVAKLAIVLAIVLNREGRAVENLSGIGHIE